MSDFYNPFGRPVLTNSHRNSIPIRTESGVLIALLAGRPKSTSWGDRMRTLGQALDAARQKVSFVGQGDHRRGTYPTYSTGLSYGGGATVSVFQTAL